MSILWVTALGSSAAIKCGQLIARIGSDSFSLTAVREEAESDVGLLVFDRQIDEVEAFVRNEQNVRPSRFLGLALQSDELLPGEKWGLIEAGLIDILDGEGPPEAVGRIIEAHLTRREAISKLFRAPLITRNLIGSAVAWRKVLEAVLEFAVFGEVPILLSGESGTGKELCARLIHSIDERRKNGELIIVDCTTLTPELTGSELFGHERGSYTGAFATREGAIGLAHGGTLFLDEIGELPLTLQGQLLRVLQERRYKRVGSNQWRSSDFRLICATNRDLLQEVEQKRFRADLYYRIAGSSVRLPPLRERRADILPLAKHFFTEFCEEPPCLDHAVREFLCAREYTGNIRELRHLVSRIAARYVGVGPVTIGTIPLGERPSAVGSTPLRHPTAFEDAAAVALDASAGLKDISRTAAEAAIRVALARAGGNVAEAARRLGVTPRALQLREASKRADG